MSALNVDQVLEACKAKGIEFIRWEQPDMHGTSRSKTVPVNHFKNFSTTGLNFLLGHLGFTPQGTCSPGTGTLEELGFPDAALFPDFSTFCVVPYADKTARVICTPKLEGEICKTAPRNATVRLLDELKAEGFEFMSGHELEFYILKRTAEGSAKADISLAAWEGMNIFTTTRNNQEEKLINNIIRTSQALGIDIITSNCEYAPGQMEIVWAPAKGIKAADDAFTFKNLAKEICQRDGKVASFMSKPFGDDASGCGFHMGQSLWTLDGRNAFHDPASKNGISKVGEYWIAGLLKHAPALSALAAPTVNCSARFKKYSFAPTNASWGKQNRTCGLRYKTGSSEGGTYIECRYGCGSANPYLLMAGCLAAGLDGLKNKLEPPEPENGIAYDAERHTLLPTDLGSALAALNADEVMCKALTPELVKNFCAVKQQEINMCKDYCEKVGGPNAALAWSQGEYFEFL